MIKQLEVILTGLVLFFLLLFIFLKLNGPIVFNVNSVATTKDNGFTVSAEGGSSQKPDSASLTVGVQADGATVQQTQNEVNTNINKVLTAIKNVGIDPNDIQTGSYNINPNYDYTKGQQITGYNASTNLTIKIKNLDNVNKVIDAATQNGATQVGSIQFDVADRQKAEDEARQKAVDAAKAKAEQAAKIAGFKLGRIINYTEDFKGTPNPRPISFGSSDIKPAAPTQIEKGSNEIKVVVSLSYEIN